MTTRYTLPDGVTAASVDGILFTVNEDGHIDVAGAHPGTVAALQLSAGARPVPTDEEIAARIAAETEYARFTAAVAEMMSASKTSAVASEAAAAETAQDEATAAAEALRQHVDGVLAERAVGEAALAAAPVEAVAAVEPVAEVDEPAQDSRSVMPPRRKK